MRKRARPVCWPRRSCSCSIPPCTSCRMVRPPRCCSPRNAAGGCTLSSCCRPSSGNDPLPPLPDAPAALSLTLTMRDVEEIDACPAALGQRLACGKAGKRWLRPPPGRDLSLRAGSPLPAALPITEQKLSGSFAKTWRQMALLFLAYSCYTLSTLCGAGRKIFPFCTINCNNRGRSSVYRVNVPNQR